MNTPAPMAMTRRTYPVAGMTCASCVLSVEKALQAVPGVQEVNVNLATGTVLVGWQDEAVHEARLKDAVQRAGYDLIVVAEADASAMAERMQADRLAGLERRLAASLAMSVPLVILGMGFMHAPWVPAAQLLLATPVVLWSGRAFFVNAWRQARHRSANMDTLVAMSTGTSYLFSLVNTLHPAFWTARGMAAGIYFEPAAVVITFVLLGRYLEERAKAGTGGAIRRLMALRPDTALRESPDGNVHEVPVAGVAVDDVLVVRPGERIAVDGEVIAGESHVDEGMLSGEPMPVAKAPGAQLLAGTINLQGALRMRAEKVGAATLLAGIVRTVQQAQGSRAPVQRQVDRVAAVFVPVVIAIAVLSAVVWWWSGGEHAFQRGLLAFVTVLVIACPCALGLATPTAIMAGMGRAAEQGILIKDAEGLERACAITAVVLDKTGTITEGRPDVVEALGMDDPAAATALLAIEHRSTHPLAEAIVRYLGPLHSAHPTLHPSHIEALPGKGVKAAAGGITWLVGSRRLLEEHGVAITGAWVGHERRWQEAARSVVWLADGMQVRGAIAIGDRIRPGAAQAIAELKRAGIGVYMQTGDARRTAQAVARAVGIDDHRSEVVPREKGAFVAGLQQQGHVVAMVGDGINDSEALARADVGIAMGRGSDIAMGVAHMTLIGTDLHGILRAIRLSRRTVRTIRQNLFWAFAYNVVGIPIAAGALIPFTGLQLDPMLAGAAMALSSVSVVLNSLRLRRARAED